MEPPLAGIFVGGASRRMGRAKGLLTLDGARLVDRALSLCDALAVDAVLVGARAEYAEVARPVIDDAPPGIGPLGGLVALMRHARGRRVVAFACDMPFVSSALLERVARSPSSAAVVAARRAGRWEPLLARYDSARVLPIAEERVRAGRFALQGLLDAAGAEAVELAADEERQLDDWDTPEDIARPR